MSKIPICHLKVPSGISISNCHSVAGVVRPQEALPLATKD